MVNIFELNLNKLNNVLRQPEHAPGPKYLIMSSKTRAAIAHMSEFKPRGLQCDTGDYRAYMGIPVAECNKLPFGNIDIID